MDLDEAMSAFGWAVIVGSLAIAAVFQLSDATQAVAAYNPATGERAWYAEIPQTTSAGNFVTAGDVVFQGVGSDMYAFDARTGAQLVKVPLGKGSRATAITYQANGRQYVAVAATTSIVTLGLPDGPR